MNIEILHRPPLRLWHERLAEALRANGHRVALRAAGDPRHLPRVQSLLLGLERRVFGPRPALFDVAQGRQATIAGTVDLTIVCDGLPTCDGVCLEPLFCGRTGDAALIDLLYAADPVFEIVRSGTNGSTIVFEGVLAIEERQIAARALEQVVARVISLLTVAVARTEVDRPRRRQRGAVGSTRPMLSGLAGKLRDRLRPGARGPNHWRIAYRIARDGGTPLGEWPPSDLRMLPDDGGRFYADPVPFVHEGRRYIFFEDYPYDSGKGVIGRVEVYDDGRTSPPRTVLEQPFHLSYPFLLRHGGEIYMLPEMGAAGRVQLFRADPFPDRWVPDRVLLDPCRAADATVFQHEGRWWLFATSYDDGGSTWDQLMLFHAADLFGPWQPHRHNPVLVDAGSGRPAGGMWIEDGVLMRVAQDCRDGYGRELTICRVDRLDPDGFEQTIVGRRGPFGPLADGTHTYFRAEGLEVVDLRYPPGSSSRNGT